MQFEDRLVTRTPDNAISPLKDHAQVADEASAREHRSRSELIRAALQWHLRTSVLPVERATSDDMAGIGAGRAEHARGETLSLDIISHDLADRVREGDA